MGNVSYFLTIRTKFEYLFNVMSFLSLRVIKIIVVLSISLCADRRLESVACSLLFVEMFEGGDNNIKKT
jgi:hypothetical protein